MTNPLSSSYRDPSGFMFEKNAVLYRQVNTVFKEDFDHFINSGCYAQLVKKGLLISHEEVNENLSGIDGWYKTLKPVPVPYISYAYEWSFDMLKDAALLHLELIQQCLPFGIILKDATPYNVQWLDGKPVFIDTLSFERYDASQPWIAYRQFCECFLSPLLLMHYSKQSLQPMQLAWPEGIPLLVTRSLLPWKSRFSFYTYLHIHLHAKIAAGTTGNESARPANFSQKKLENLIQSLKSLVQSLKLREMAGAWGNYYDEARERNGYLEQKKSIIEQWLDQFSNAKAIDLGANKGEFARLLAKKNMQTIAADFSHAAINNLYLDIKQHKGKNILPLVIDLSNPSPAIGVNNKERDSFIERTKVDLALALALIHHLSIGKNIPFEKTAGFFAKLGKHLIIEFVPAQDEKVQFMLKQKKDIYKDYTEPNFEKSFSKLFSIEKKQEVGSSGRILYLMKRL